MKKYLYFKKSNNKLTMISDGLNKYDKDVLYVELMKLTKTQLEKILQAEETFLEKGKLKIKPKIDRKKELKDKLEKANDLDKIKQVVKEILNL